MVSAYFVLFLGAIAMGDGDAKLVAVTPANPTKSLLRQAVNYNGQAVPVSVDHVLLQGGRQRDVELLIVDNGVMIVTLVPTRGLGILEIKTKAGVRLGWDSPIKEVVHPQYMSLPSRGGLGWLEGFNEFMCRCGLENNGGPGKDEFITNTGDKGTLDLTLHGKIANIPANQVTVELREGSDPALIIRGHVDETTFHGPKLRLQTATVIPVGRFVVRNEDQVENLSASPTEYELLYHVNFGKPILEGGAQVSAAYEKVMPMNARAAEGIATWDTYAAPTSGYVEQVYLVWPKADANGLTEAVLQNQAGSLGAAIRFNTRQLPYLTVWKNTTALEDGYVTGIEPGTNFPFPRNRERQEKRVPVLQAKAKVAFTVEYEVLPDSAAVAAARKRVTVLQGSTPGTVMTKPPVEPQTIAPSRD